MGTTRYTKKKVGRKKKKDSTAISLRKEEPLLSLTQLSKKKEEFLNKYANPLDLSTEKELAEELEVPLQQIVDWRDDAEIASLTWSRFQPAFQNIRVPLMKDLIRQALKGKSQKANEKLLEILGVIQGKNGPTMNIFNFHGGSIVAQAMDKMTDLELDKEIARLQESIAVPDITYLDGETHPTQEILDVDYEELKVYSDLDGSDEVRPTRVRVDKETETGETVCSSDRETEEDSSK